LHAFKKRILIFGIRISKRVRDLVPLSKGRSGCTQSRYNGFENRMLRVERGLLGHIRQLESRLCPGLSIVKASLAGEGP